MREKNEEKSINFSHCQVIITEKIQYKKLLSQGKFILLSMEICAMEVSSHNCQ